MAMNIDTTGLDELSRMLAEVGNRANEIAAGALFDGAAVVANAMNAAVNSMQTEPFQYATNGRKRLASPAEKAALQRKIGIARFRKDGDTVDTIIGIGGDGYANVAGKKTPVIALARSINSGTTFRVKQPVFRKAVTNAKQAAQAAIVASAERLINEITNK